MNNEAKTKQLFSKIDLDNAELMHIKNTVKVSGYSASLHMLRKYVADKINLKNDDNQLSAYLIDNFNDDVRESIKVADEILRKEFLFRYEWDMEKTQIPFVFKEEINWNEIPFGDPEWCYMLNRHRYWIALGQAYSLTGNESYTNEFMKRSSHWIERNKMSGEKNHLTCRTIEIGIRCENWIKALTYFIGSNQYSDDAFVSFLLTLYEHGKQLASHFTEFSVTSNWGIIESNGLYYLSSMLDIFNESLEWQEIALSRLVKCLKVQIYPDGLHWEQSSTYHNEVLRGLLSVLRCDKKNGLATDETIKSVAKKMAGAIQLISKPNHKQPLNGDSDEVDIRDLLSEAAYLLKDPVFKFGGLNDFGYENIWNYGLTALEAYEKLEAIKPKVCSASFEYAKNYVMRSSWHEDALYMMFDCGPMGGGHGHADLFHFDVFAYGRDFIIDSGRYTYRSDAEMRSTLKGCKAHNTLIVDDLDFTEYKDTWQYGKIAKDRGQIWKSNEIFDYVEGSHDGYLALEDPVYPTRKIIFVKPFYWIVADIVECKKQHKIKRYFHFKDTNIEQEINEANTTYETGANLKIMPLNNENNLKSSIKKSYYSPEYNLLEENSVLVYENEVNGFSTHINLIYPYLEDRVSFEEIKVFDRFNRSIDKYYAEAMKVTFLNRLEEHLILIVHHSLESGNDAFIVDKTLVYGEIVLIKRSNDKEEIITIS